jgi:pentatricopeptide repeat protein
MIYNAQGKIDDARRVYEEMIARGLDAPVAANNLAWIYVDRGEKLDEALGLAQRAKQRFPDRPEVSDTLGWIYVKQGLPRLAISPLQKSVEAAPKNALFQYHLGMAYAKAGKVPEARASLQEALRLRADFAGADEARATLASLKQ